jgi:hypothetical protein
MFQAGKAKKILRQTGGALTDFRADGMMDKNIQLFAKPQFYE